MQARVVEIIIETAQRNGIFQLLMSQIINAFVDGYSPNPSAKSRDAVEMLKMGQNEDENVVEEVFSLLQVIGIAHTYTLYQRTVGEIQALLTLFVAFPAPLDDFCLFLCQHLIPIF